MIAFSAPAQRQEPQVPASDHVTGDGRLALDLDVGTPRSASRRVKLSGIALIIVVGLLNFHVPHFLIQSPAPSGYASLLLELVLLVNVVGAVIAAVGIYRNLRWGWLVGLAIAVVSVLLYLLQETVGLPGLPKAWLEPSRIVSLLVEALFAVLAGFQLAARSWSPPVPGR